MKLSTSLIPALALSVFGLLGLAGCERLEPKPEFAVGLQASGYFAEKPASLTIQGSIQGLIVEIRDKEKQDLLASGMLQDEEMGAFLAEVKGPMTSSLTSTTLHILQSGKVHRELPKITGSAAKEGVRATLDIEGTRWIQYNSGLLEHGMEGRVHFTLKKADGTSLGQFEGLTTRQTAGTERVAVGVNVEGEITGDHSLGGGLLASAVPARLYMSLPNGAGAVVAYGSKQVFSFDPNADMKNVEGQMGIIGSSESYLELTDSFKGDIKLGNVDLGDGKRASSKGDFSYDISISVMPDKILVTGKGAVNAFLTTAEGKKAEFHGHNDHIQTELDW